MGIIAWIFLGGIAGWLASKIMKTDKDMGVIANIIVGILGALIGGFLVGLIGGGDVTGFNPYSILVALLGACVLLGIIKAIRR